MKNKDCDIATSIKVLGWCLIGIVILYFCKEFLGYPSTKEFLEGQGSLIAGIIAFIAAVIALYSQRESVQKQLDFQKNMDESKVFREKLEELYSDIQALKINITLTRTDMIKNSVQDVDIFIVDIGRIVMLQGLYKIADEELFQEYASCTYRFLEAWSGFAGDYITKQEEGVQREIIPEEVEFRSYDIFLKSNIFFENTDKLLDHLLSLIK